MPSGAVFYRSDTGPIFEVKSGLPMRKPAQCPIGRFFIWQRLECEVPHGRAAESSAKVQATKRPPSGGLFVCVGYELD
jgi:hypothetical protein